MASLNIKLLGGFEVSRGPKALPKLPTQRIQSLFAYLVTYKDRSHPREVLAEIFWPNSGAERARSNLRNSLYILRQWVNGFLTTDRLSVAIDRGRSLFVDVEEFQNLVLTSRSMIGQDRFSALQQALQLYRGDFLPGFYDDWVLNVESRLKLLYQEVADTLSQLPHPTSSKTHHNHEGQREAELKMELAKAHHQMKRMEPVLLLAEQAFRLYENERVPDKQADAAILLGSAQRHLGQYDLARKYYEIALVLSQPAKDLRNKWRVLNNLGWLEWNLDQSHQALGFYKQALPICQSHGDHWGEAVILNNTGIAYLDLQEPVAALRAFSEAYKVISSLGDKELKLENHSYKALAQLQLGSMTAANESIRRVLDLLQQGVGSRLSHKAHLNLWRVLSAGKHRKDAARHLQWAYENVMARAKQITSAKLKKSFLRGNRSNREIISAWKEELKQ